jgi:hypothetical protein
VKTYSEERKESVLKRLRPPYNESAPTVSRAEGIPKSTLHTWIKDEGRTEKMSAKKVSLGGLSAEARFTIIVEAALLGELECGEYCRERGLYPEQIKSWKRDFILGVEGKSIPNPDESLQTKKDKQIIKQLEKDLSRKEKALAEAAALLILRKKLHAFYEEGNEDD